MFQKEYYNIIQLAARWSELFKKSVAPCDVIHLGISERLPIYVSVIRLRALLGKKYPINCETETACSFCVVNPHSTPPKDGFVSYAKDLELIDHYSLRIFDQQGIYETSLKVAQVSLDIENRAPLVECSTLYLQLLTDRQPVEFEVDLESLIVSGASALKLESAAEKGNQLNPQLFTLEASSYWRDLKTKAAQAVDQYPGWRQQVKGKFQKSLMDDWLTTSLKYSAREAEIIKKILTDIFN
ncbi:hypothetical protein KC887_05495 [Candidatus Kaiserbacteria bacterium]|nr:hypothetical protein [Candidatus Kaiserbacteria bacterium]